MNALDTFGRFMIANLRDKAIEQNRMILAGQCTGKAVRSMQARLVQMSDSYKALVEEMVTDLIDSALHDLLFAIQDAHDRGLGIEVIVDGQNVADASGMLQGEHVGAGGWIERFSKFPKDHMLRSTP